MAIDPLPKLTGTSPADVARWADALVAHFETKAERASEVPSGTVAPFASDILPDGWLWAEGQTLPAAEWPELYASLGDKWNLGDETPGYFRLPDMRGNMAMGWLPVPEDEEEQELPPIRQGLQYGGSPDFTLSIPNLPRDIPIKVTDPKHTHTVNGQYVTPGAGPVSVSAPITGQPTVSVPTVGAAATPTINLSATNITALGRATETIEGGDSVDAVSIIPPFIAFRWIIKI